MGGRYERPKMEHARRTALVDLGVAAPPGLGYPSDSESALSSTAFEIESESKAASQISALTYSAIIVSPRSSCFSPEQTEWPQVIQRTYRKRFVLSSGVLTAVRSFPRISVPVKLLSVLIFAELVSWFESQFPARCSSDSRRHVTLVRTKVQRWPPKRYGNLVWISDSKVERVQRGST
jgi:hypothetical protein